MFIVRGMSSSSLSGVQCEFKSRDERYSLVISGLRIGSGVCLKDSDGWDYLTPFALDYHYG